MTQARMAGASGFVLDSSTAHLAGERESNQGDSMTTIPVIGPTALLLLFLGWVSLLAGAFLLGLGVA